MKVYITSPRGKEKLVQAFKDAGAEVVRRLDSDVRLIIPTVDEELPFFAQSKDYFLSKGIRVMVSSDYAIYECRDKTEFYRFCRRHDFETPPTMQQDLIVKPRFGKGSRGQMIVDESYIVQPLIKGREVSIDYFADWNGDILSLVPRYRENVVKGESQSMTLVENYDFSMVSRMAYELKLVGHNVIQGFITDKGFVFTEVNPRFGGGSWMTFKYFNGPEWLVKNS